MKNAQRFHFVALAVFLACLIGYALAGFPTEGQELNMTQAFDSLLSSR